MARSWLSPSMVRWSSGLLASVAMVAAVTGVIVLLERHIPVLNLLVLYLLAVLSVAIFWGSRLAALTAVLSVGGFALLLPPRGSLQIADAEESGGTRGVPGDCRGRWRACGSVPAGGGGVGPAVR